LWGCLGVWRAWLWRWWGDVAFGWSRGARLRVPSTPRRAGLRPPCRLGLFASPFPQPNPEGRRLLATLRPSDSPRGGPSTRLRMHCAPTAPADVSYMGAGGALRRGGPFPRCPFRFAKDRRAPFSGIQRGAVDDGAGADFVASFGEPVRLLRRLAPPRNDGCEVDGAMNGAVASERCVEGAA